ncbi:MAG TPA: diaminopimelate decarboxylase [Candidatus Aminicenantes bacterium]|nr:MAG: diaminopimelate decarboxylase [Candidatus Aminicenantes bacterium]HEK86182.1 diaminopimelate decarboxylase [Candidatus Aminicenantes bacterium]
MSWWQDEFLNIKNNKLYLEEKSAEEIVRKYGTPVYIYSRKKILNNLQNIQEAFSSASPELEVRIAYAMKANPHPAILKTLLKKGCWIDAVSPAEVKTALKAGFPEYKIMFTGTSISLKDFERVLKHPEVTINLDAYEQIEILAEARKKMRRKKPVRVSVRWNPGLGRGFSSKTVTAGERSSDGTPIKFGVEEASVIEAFKKLKKLGFEPVGLHQHLGSGWTEEDFPVAIKAVDRMIKKARELKKAGFNLEFLDFGGGFGPKYRAEQRLFPLAEYAAYILDKVESSKLDLKAITVEPGKYLVANAGVLLMKVEYVKKSYRNLFACVNAGTYNTVPRPAIYEEAYHEIVNASCVNGRQKTKITVAGHLCETGDVFGVERLMPMPRRGHIMAVLMAGAYCHSMASNFNLRPIPKEIIL